MNLSYASSAAPDLVRGALEVDPKAFCKAEAQLREHPLFAGLEGRDFEEMLFQIRRLKFGKKALLYRQNTPAQYFYFVISGSVRLYRLDATGIDRTLDSLAPGDCFAEVMVYAEPARYACYAETMASTLVLAIPLHVYKDTIRRSPHYAERALRHFAGRAVSRFHDLEVMTVQNARERLIRYLLDLVPADGNTAQEVALPLPKYLVASRLAMQPETLSRFLNDLKQRGLVTMERNRVSILDRRRLMTLCQSSQERN